jgi:hypothetical protein
MARRFVLTSSVLSACLITLSLTCSADNLRFMKSSPLAYFKGDDYALMQKNATATLDSTDEHAKHEWRNSETGSSGLAEVRSEFTNTDGVLCKRLRIVNRAGGMESDATYAVCKYEGRGWLLHPDAVPLKPGRNE